MQQSTLLKIAVMAFFAGMNPGASAQPTSFNYQGQLSDGGKPAAGTYDIAFAVYDAPANGNLVSAVVTNLGLNVANGVFTTTVDFGSGVFAGSDLWLQIAVSTNGANAFSIIGPRQQFRSAPYAIFAASSGTANAVASSTISAPQLNTAVGPVSGQVLGYNGTQLVWQDAVLGGSSGGWSLSGNLGTTPGLNFLGTADNTPLELKVGGARALRLEPDLAGSGAPNVIGGSAANYVSNTVVGATIAGGGAVSVSGTPYSNSVTAPFGTIAGGARNLAAHQFASALGGFQNVASGYISTVAGGAYNSALNNEAFVGGGAYNTADFYSVVAGGDFNTATGIDSVVVGGLANLASGPYSFVGGGSDSSDAYPPVGNVASGNYSVVVGGDGNHATQDDATVGGGADNVASGIWSTVPGGAGNTAAGVASMAAGYNAHAANQGAFVWADNSSASPWTSSSDYQFVIRAIGGVGINTTQTPPGGLRVDNGGLAVTGASSPQYGTAQGVFVERFGNSAGAVYAYNYAQAKPIPLILNSPGGNVGIGTLSPQYTLDVNGTTRTHSLVITGGADLAEPFKVGAGEIEQGSVVVIDPAHPGQLKMSAQAYDTRVAGIVSGANGIHPAISLRQDGALEEGQNVALSGRVYVLADATSAEIQPGDLLTTSAIPGHAMKVTDHARAQGAILGKAMGGLAQGRGLVLVLVTLQ